MPQYAPNKLEIKHRLEILANTHFPDLFGGEKSERKQRTVQILVANCLQLIQRIKLGQILNVSSTLIFISNYMNLLLGLKSSRTREQMRGFLIKNSRQRDRARSVYLLVYLVRRVSLYFGAQTSSQIKNG